MARAVTARIEIGSKSPDRIVGEIAHRQRVEHMRAGPAEQQRISVGRGARDRGGSERAAGPALVLDHDGAERALHAFGPQAGGDVVDAAWRERHHQADRAVGILSLCGRGRGVDDRGRAPGGAEREHVTSGDHGVSSGRRHCPAFLSGASPCRRTGIHPGSSPGQAFAGTCAVQPRRKSPGPQSGRDQAGAAAWIVV